MHKLRSIQNWFVEIGVEELVESLPRIVEAVIAAKGGTNSIFMPVILE
jgi:hypothetical protein